MNIALGSLQETLLIPLWSRANLSRAGNPFSHDPAAIRLVEHLDYDFERLDKTLPYFLQLMNLIRAKMFDDTITVFAATHPEAVIVNLGCGLDTTFSRVDNYSLLWL